MQDGTSDTVDAPGFPEAPVLERMGSWPERAGSPPRCGTVQCSAVGHWGRYRGLVEATAPCREDSQGTSHPVRAARQMEAILLPLLPVQTALASMYVVIMPHLLLAAMALTVVGDFFLHATRGPRLIGVHLRAPVGDGLWVHVGHGGYPPVAPIAQSRRRGQGVAQAERSVGPGGPRRDTDRRTAG